MSQAVASGVVDLAVVDPHDADWLYRLLPLLLQVERQSRITYDLASFNRLSAVLGRDTPPTGTLDQSDQLLDKLWHRLFPWYAQEKQVSSDEQLRNEWVHAFGDPNDPETQQKIAATAKWLHDNDLARKR